MTLATPPDHHRQRAAATTPSELGFGRASVEGELDVDPLDRLFARAQQVPTRQTGSAATIPG